MAMIIYSLVVVWFHRPVIFRRFPFRPWYHKKEEPSFADMLTTLRRVSYNEKTRATASKTVCISKPGSSSSPSSSVGQA